MLRHSLLYLLLSILLVIFVKYIHLVIVYIDLLFTYINIELTPLFRDLPWGSLIRHVVILVCLPLIITLIPALIYRLFKGKNLPHFTAVVWTVWMVIVLSDILIR